MNVVPMQSNLTWLIWFGWHQIDSKKWGQTPKLDRLKLSMETNKVSGVVGWNPENFSCLPHSLSKTIFKVTDLWKEAHILGQPHHPHVMAFYGDYGSTKKIMDAAFGIEYLHEKNIVHFDFKSHNLLVNMRDPQRPVCKIDD
ncbi:hypothetical protein Vadar_034703 [Vaccinium darrowii]|uniref:Uncharacterized protein n=1 Tax=Vaccinium darrowii TaxID=229202 RepID=A0ACB7Z8D7_9ERIC|nr:hypothetical protein Vadar_034703 [Vaccinium darrowii]